MNCADLHEEFFLRLKITKLVFKMRIFQNEEFLDNNNKDILSKVS